MGIGMKKYRKDRKGFAKNAKLFPCELYGSLRSLRYLPDKPHSFSKFLILFKNSSAVSIFLSGNNVME